MSSETLPARNKAKREPLPPLFPSDLLADATR